VNKEKKFPINKRKASLRMGRETLALGKCTREKVCITKLMNLAKSRSESLSQIAWEVSGELNK